MPHQSNGEVAISAYEALLSALNTGYQNAFEQIPLGGDRKLTNPQCGLAFDLEGKDAFSYVQPPPPACVTILKAWFDESFVIANPVEPDVTGQVVVPYSGSADLTVGGELNKVAANVALGRNTAGVHWRSDATQSMLLGEALAISVLKDQKSAYNEQFNGFSLTKFDGTTITV